MTEERKKIVSTTLAQILGYKVSIEDAQNIAKLLKAEFAREYRRGYVAGRASR